MQPERTRPKKAGRKDPGTITVNQIRLSLAQEYFQKFGVVTEVVMIYDAEKQRPRGFGFITFENDPSVDQAVNMHFHDIMGKKVEVQRAEPRDSESQGPGQPGAGQWGSRVMPSARQWLGRPAPTYVAASIWPTRNGVPAGQAIGGCGPPPAGRGAPPPPPPFTSYIVSTLLEGSLLHGASCRATAPSHLPNSVLAMGLHLHRQISLRHQGSPLHLPLLGQQHLWPSRRLPLRLAAPHMSKPPTPQPDFPYSQYGLGTDSQDPVASDPDFVDTLMTRPGRGILWKSHTQGAKEPHVARKPQFADHNLGPRLWTGLDRLLAGFLRPQPAAPVLWGPLSARLREAPLLVEVASDEVRTTMFKDSTPTNASSWCHTGG
ncbi:hypothetical protein QTO34_014701 [Cnephaeus nilssonii]|uniref:RRM domain-containing protein n=1 Tax=Cnephaeus nilssonii TaxID=3371016 RepID=A0AA40I726_CNENI|nr:hypothetical protein QTO34_014701 [Eptesicus nilssonii]